MILIIIINISTIRFMNRLPAITDANYPQTSCASAREWEHRKSRDEKQDETAYVFGHMVTCLATDPVTGPVASSFTQRFISGKAHVKEHFEGEFLGDIVAVPVTIAIQRFLPEVTGMIRGALEPVATPFYRFSALRETTAWAKRHGVSRESDAFKEHQDRLTDYELKKIPLQATWTLTSLAFNVAGQKAFFGNPHSAGEIALSVSIGSLATLMLQNATRVLTPELAHGVDHQIKEHVVKPVTQVVNRITTLGKVSDPSSQIMGITY